MSYIVVEHKSINTYDDFIDPPPSRRRARFPGLTDLVNDKIRQGYLPKGGISAYVGPGGQPMFIQAMYNPVPVVPVAVAAAGDPVAPTDGPRGGTRRSKKARRT